MSTEHTAGVQDRQIELLRIRFLELARRRVPADAAEDLVHEALGIIHARGDETPDGLPPLAWCFQVLRNVIGNWYQRRDSRERWEQRARLQESPVVITPLQALEEREALSRIERGLRRLAKTDPNCGRYLRRIVEGADSAEVAAQEGIEAGAFYRRLYRCRAKLRELLREEGIWT
jgi:RNA polymerase sigma factor (sigma-70 family)